MNERKKLLELYEAMLDRLISDALDPGAPSSSLATAAKVLQACGITGTPSKKAISDLQDALHKRADVPFPSADDITQEAQLGLEA